MNGIDIRNYTTPFWGIDKQASDNYLPLVASFLDGKLQATEQKVKECKSEVVSAEDYGMQGQGGAIAVIHISGPIVRYSDWYSVGTTAIAKTITAAAEDEAIGSIVLRIDSPGGSVNALPVIRKALSSAREKKKIYAHVQTGMICSAAYYIASFAHEIYAEDALDVVGSIGVMCSWYDFQGFWEKYGAKYHEVYATESTEKNLDFRNAKEGDYERLRIKYLDAYYGDFAAVVAENREGKVSEKAMKGDTFFTEEAIELNLLDGQMTFEELINRAAVSGSSSTTKSMFGKKNPVEAVVSTPSAERTEEQYAAANDFLAKNGINVLLLDDSTTPDAAKALLVASEENSNKVVQLTGELATVKGNLAAAEATVSSAESKLKAYAGEDFESIDASIDGLVAIAGKEKPGKQSTPKGSEMNSDDPQAVIDSLEHNRRADENL